jgi:hypothetical protein
MRYSPGLVIVALAYLGTVQCIDFGKLFGWLKNPFGIFREKVRTATNCKVFQNRRICKFNATSLKLDVNNAIELVVNPGGRKITCNKLLSKGKKRWYGSCDGDADDANFITRVDRSGKESVHGSIHVGSDVCRIGPNILGEDEIQCIPQADFKAEDDPKDIPNTESSENDRMQTIGDTTFGFSPAPYIQNVSQSSLRGYNQHHNDRELFDDLGSNIDIMVVWTREAECGAAGLSASCTVTTATENIMRGVIDLAIAETNAAYQFSGIFTVLRLVHAYRDPDYVEGGSFGTYLDHLTNSNDGFLDTVHAKRVLYGADMVGMIVGTYFDNM